MDAGVGLNGLRIARMRSIIGRMPVVPRLLPPMPGRALAVLPDFATAVACLVVWIRPFAFGANGVKTIVLMMLMEFLLVHGTGFFTQVAFADAAGKGRRLLMMAGLLLFYAVFVAAFAWSFRAWWPAWVFLWLVVGKATWIFSSPRDRAAERDRQMKAWAASVVCYLAAVFASVMLPWPRLGISVDAQPRFDLHGGGEWIEQPHRAVAAMALYYLLCVAWKWRASRPGAAAATAQAA